jgi:hypothetical protein
MPRVSKCDLILATRPVGETYEINGSNHKVQFTKVSLNEYHDLNKNKTYTTAGEILRQHCLEHLGTTHGASTRPKYIKITSGLDRGKKLSDI